MRKREREKRNDNYSIGSFDAKKYGARTIRRKSLMKVWSNNEGVGE